ncbi:MAG: hypothetical protein HGA59_05285 [Chlorobiaceae bacterium]|jgi:hypothetical protein|nr:hypothetical protein [Chlorobiaceae bacterium]NTV16982.1 hypothetical protein [Chlorobiaceae bacterium]
MISDLLNKLASAFTEIDYTINQLKRQKLNILTIEGEQRKEMIELLGAHVMDIETIAKNLNDLIIHLSLAEVSETNVWKFPIRRYN